MGGACSQKLKSRRGLPSSSGRFCIGWDAATLTQDPIGQQKPASPGLQLVGEIHYCWGGSNLGWVISAKRPSRRSLAALCGQHHQCQESLADRNSLHGHSLRRRLAGRLAAGFAQRVSDSALQTFVLRSDSHVVVPLSAQADGLRDLVNHLLSWFLHCSRNTKSSARVRRLHSFARRQAGVRIFRTSETALRTFSFFPNRERHACVRQTLLSFRRRAAASPQCASAYRVTRLTPFLLSIGDGISEVECVGLSFPTARR